jgi:hypothetical protein
MEIIHSCWFCDEPADCEISSEGDTYSAQIYCDNCGAKGPLLEDFSTEEDAEYCATEKWNNPLVEF